MTPSDLCYNFIVIFADFSEFNVDFCTILIAQYSESISKLFTDVKLVFYVPVLQNTKRMIKNFTDVKYKHLQTLHL